VRPDTGLDQDHIIRTALRAGGRSSVIPSEASGYREAGAAFATCRYFAESTLRSASDEGLRMTLVLYRVPQVDGLVLVGAAVGLLSQYMRVVNASAP
jgi:hypothetical protein